MSVQDILINGKISSQYYNGATFPNIDIDQVTGLESALTVITDDITDINNSVGQADGICPLNSMGQIDPSYLDPSVFTFEGTWDAFTNTPILTNGVGNIGDIYIVSVGGVRFGETFIAGDYCVYVNGLWEKIASGSNSVTSVTAGTNVSISGTAVAPVVNVVASPAFTQVSSSAPVPIANGDLARKDYVDARLLMSANLSDVQSLPTTKINLQVEKIPNVKQTLNASVPPTINDDSTQGYDIASRIIDTVADKEYVCLDNSIGAAIWKETTQQATGEVNTASNLGVSTYGLFKSKVGTDLQFKSITAGSNKINLISNADDVSVDVNQANLTLTKSQVGLSNVDNIKSNFTAIIDPSVNDDSTLFYSVGSRWYNNTTDTIFECFDATVAAAIWTANVSAGQNVGFAPVSVFRDKTNKTLNFRNLTSTFGANIVQYADYIDFIVDKTTINLGNVENTKSSFSAIVDPTIADGASGGWTVGSLWLNVTTDVAFICLDSTNGSAVWDKLQYSFSNVGAGSGVFKQLTSSNDAVFKTLVQTSNQVLITSGTDTLTFATPQDIHSTANTNFQSVTLSQASGNAVNLTGANSLIRLGGTNSAIINNGINGNIGRVDISRGCQYFFYNNALTAAMNITNNTTDHIVNVSNLGGGNIENIFSLIPVTPQYFPFANVQNIRGDLSQTSMYCAWRINDAYSVTTLRFGLMSQSYYDDYPGNVGATTNRRGLYNAGNTRNTVTLQWTTTGGTRHQNDDVLATSVLGTPYAAGTFVANDIIILESTFNNPPRLRLHSYSLLGNIATWKGSNTYDLRSGSMVGGDAMSRGYAYINLHVVGQNVDVLGQRWITNNINIWVHAGGNFNHTTAMSYYY